MDEPSSQDRSVLVAVEQLRRRVPGGIGRYASGLLAGLASPDVDHPTVRLLASRHLGTAPDPLLRWGFEVREARVPAPFLTWAWDLGLCAAPGAAAVVHSVSLAFPPTRPRREGGPALVVTVHDLAWRSHPSSTTPRGRRWHEGALRRALVRADAFVTPSEPVADALVAEGVAVSRVRVIGHGVDHLPAPDLAGAAALLKRLGVDDGYLLTVGTLEPRKNLRRLVAAYGHASRSMPEPWPLVVVGPRGWGGTGVEWSERVVAAGAVGDGVLRALYGGARAFVYVPLGEGFGLPPLEAMASGAPVVVSTAVPSTSPAGPEAPALLVDPTSVDAIAHAIVEAATDGSLRAELVRRGEAHAATHTWASSAAAHVALWRELGAVTR